MFGLFKKKKPKVETKNHGLGGQYSTSFVDFLRGNGNYDLSAYMCMQYYSQVSAVNDSVDRQAKAFSGLKLTVKDRITGELYPNHDVLKLLAKPNKEQTQSEFMLGVATYLKAAGYSGIYSTGDNRRPPLELCVTPPQYLTASTGSALPDYISVSGIDYSDQFELFEDSDLFRYHHIDNTGSKDRELYIIKEFNPKLTGNLYFGMSKLTPLYQEIEQFVNSNTHNLSLLERGARPSGIMTTSADLDDTQYLRLREQLSEFYSGAKNAGRIMIGQEVDDFKELSQSNKDMDFSTLKTDVKNAIYNTFHIPLALVNTSSMTMDNLKVSQLFFYDQAVLPLAKKILNDLTRFLMYRYKGSENLEITYVESEIEALAPRRLQNIETINKMNIATDNELREMVDMEPYNGGDTHYMPSNLLPVGEFSIDDPVDELDESVKTRSIFIKSLEQQVDNKNNPIYSKVEIKKMADLNGLIDG